MQITSPAFKDGGRIPQKHVMPGAGGDNLSIPLSWKGAPPGTRSFALSIVDLHPVANSWVHWLAINLPASVLSLPEGASGKKMPSGSAELQNSFGDIGYGGPQPPIGTGDHSYLITLYALSTEKLDLKPNTYLSQFRKSLEGKVLASSAITGKFGR